MIPPAVALPQPPGRALASSTAIAHPQRQPLGGFVQTWVGVTDIHSPRHATALIGSLQLAGAHQSGLLGSMGHVSRQAWFQSNASALFRSDGPLGGYNEVSASVLMRHVLGAAERHARDLYGRSHSSDTTGAEHEDVPA